MAHPAQRARRPVVLSCPPRFAPDATATSSCDREPPPSASAADTLLEFPALRARRAHRSHRPAARQCLLQHRQARRTKAAGRTPVPRGSHQGHAVQRRGRRTKHHDFAVRRTARSSRHRRQRRRRSEGRRDRLRKRGDKSISSIKMDAGKAPPTTARRHVTTAESRRRNTRAARSPSPIRQGGERSTNRWRPSRTRITVDVPTTGASARVRSTRRSTWTPVRQPRRGWAQGLDASTGRCG